tara:strand:+ start:482 stop:640 length:159 start_codon:yes stop_codon:yes gene_type:complete
MNLTSKEKEILLACLEFTKNGPVGFEALEGYLEMDEEEIYALLPEIGKKLGM